MAQTGNTKGNASEQTGEGQAPQDIHVREPLTLILPDNNKFTSYLFSTFRRGANTIVVLLLIAAVPITMVLLSNQQDVRQRAGFEATPTIVKKHNISGKVYIDTNANKTRDSWENGPEGATIEISSDTIKIEVQTDNYGSYSLQKFDGLIEGQYTVTLESINGYAPISASSVNVKLGPSDAIVDFGIQKSTSTPRPSL